MSDHQKGTARTAQISFEVFDCVDIQVVCRLVHDEELCLRSKHLRESNSLDLAAGQLLHLLVRIRQIEFREELHDPPFIFP